MNHPVRRNPIASFFVGLWDVMNFTRRLIFIDLAVLDPGLSPSASPGMTRRFR